MLFVAAMLQHVAAARGKDICIYPRTAGQPTSSCPTVARGGGTLLKGAEAAAPSCTASSTASMRRLHCSRLLPDDACAACSCCRSDSTSLHTAGMHMLWLVCCGRLQPSCWGWVHTMRCMRLAHTPECRRQEAAAPLLPHCLLTPAAAPAPPPSRAARPAASTAAPSASGWAAYAAG